MNKVSISRTNRAARVKWLKENIPYSEDRYVYMWNRGFRFMIYAYLTDEELLIYKLIFGK